MVEIDLTNSDLFKNLIEFEARGVSIDLHNEYTCHSIDFDNKNDNFNLRFKLDNNSAGKINQVDIAFANCFIKTFSLKGEAKNIDAWTIDNIYRGRFEKEAGVLSEITEDGRFYYYIEFYGEHTFELFAKRVSAKIS